MPRPPAVPRDFFVDAGVCARGGSRVERRFTAAQLPRLAEAGVRSGSVDARFRFSQLEELPAIDGELSGAVTTTCQRCMRAVSVPLDERFQVVIVAQERADESAGYEPVIAEAARLDLRWLTEEQVLLAMPLVAMHESDDCSDAQPTSSQDEDEAEVKQKPFQNLRDLLRQR